MNGWYALLIGCGMGFGLVAGCVAILYVADWRDRRKKRRSEQEYYLSLEYALLQEAQRQAEKLRK